MFLIKSEPYGFRVTTEGSLTLEEVSRLKSELLAALSSHGRPFSLLLDSRKMVVPSAEVLEVFTELHSEVWELPCVRVAFILESPVSHRRAVQMHYSSAPGSNDRFINALQYSDWESRAEAWLTRAVEPEAVRTPDPS